MFPIEDFNKTASLEYVDYEIGEPKYDEDECLAKGNTFEAPIRIRVRLVVYDVDEETGNRTIRDIKEQDIYFGAIPLMTDKGTFIINGTERVIVNQLQRSPGIIFEHDSGKSHSSRKVLYSCRVIPMRGSWLDFDFDHKDILYVRIDRRRKMPVTILFKAMGMTKADILHYFYAEEGFRLEGADRVLWEVDEAIYRKENALGDITAPDGAVLVKAGRPITKRAWRDFKAKGVEAVEGERSHPARPLSVPGFGGSPVRRGHGRGRGRDHPRTGGAGRVAKVDRLTVLHTRGVDVSPHPSGYHDAGQDRGFRERPDRDIPAAAPQFAAHSEIAPRSSRICFAIPTTTTFPPWAGTS